MGGGASSPGHSTRKVSLCRGRVNSRQPEAEAEAEAEEQSPRGVIQNKSQDVSTNRREYCWCKVEAELLGTLSENRLVLTHQNKPWAWTEG